MRTKNLQMKRVLRVALFVLLQIVLGMTMVHAENINLRSITETCEITATLNWTGSGWINGSGTYNQGDTCTLMATPYSGFLFACWTKDGAVVSREASYTFTVTESANYVANFVNLPPENGVSVGGYNSGSYSCEYYLPCGSLRGYFLTQQIYTADEIGCSGTINSLVFYNTWASATRICDFYLKTTEKTMFDNNMDWIAVTEVDRVFSGSVTFSQNWTVVNFDTPFEYDGNSNLVLVVDDHTESYTIFGAWMRFQVCNTTGAQSLYVKSESYSSTPFDPTNPFNYNGTLNAEKNRIVFGGLTNNGTYNVTGVTDPADGGVVMGQGTYQGGSTCVFTATPNPGYEFVNWTKNGAVISTNAWFSFPVAGDCQVEAHFTRNSIDFADSNVKALCVANWDTNGDGELSYAEATAVTDLGVVFKQNYSITSFDELQYFTGLTSIGEKAFAWCHGLTSIVIPSTVTSLGFEAFYDCRSLLSITIPASVTTIGSSALSGCDVIEQMSVEEGNTVYDSREDCNGVIVTATNTLLYGCKNTIIPNSVTTISSAFSHCGGLTSIHIPASVTSISGNSFYACESLAEITVDEANTVYDSRSNCNAIIKTSTNVLVAGSQTTIIPNTITSIGVNAFSYRYRYGMYNIIIPESVVSIGNNAYLGGYAIDTIMVFPQVPPTLGGNAFQYVPKDIPVYVPYGTVEAYQSANGWSEFTNIQELGNCPSSIVFADSNVKALCVANWDTNGDGELSYAEAAAVTDLGQVFKSNYAITSFDELQYFTGLTSICSEAFAWCLYMTSVQLPSTVTSIGSSAFYDCRSLLSITIPASVTAIGSSALNCSNMEAIVVEEGNAIYDSRDNCNALIITSSNMLIRGCKNTIIPNTVVSIASNAFSSCAMESMSIPASVTSINYTSFYACENLSELIVDVDNTVYDSRDSCNAIIKTSTNNLIAGSKTTFIPNTVVSIGAYAFSYRYRYGSYNIIIPESVVSIGNSAYLGGYAIDTIMVFSQVPPTLGGNAFQYVPKNIPVYVPCGTVVAYQSANGWSEFTNIQEICSQPQTITLSQGWNWISTNIDTNEVDCLAMLEEALGDYGVSIATSDDIAEYLGDGFWLGLEGYQWTNGEMIMVEVSEDCTVSLVGPAVDPSYVTITINPGWNWIGFPVGSEITLEDALADFEPELGDGIASYEGITEYIGTWTGDFMTLVPSHGYLYYSASATPKTLVFSTGAK